MENIKSFIPLGLLIPFLIIIGIEILVIFLLIPIEKSLNNQISLLEERVKNKEESITREMIDNENFIVFSQMVNIVEILKNRKLAGTVIEKFNSLMPKFLNIESFSFDNEKQEISFKANVNNLTDYLRFLYYLNNHLAFEVKSITPPEISKEDDKVNFSTIIKLKVNFYQ